MVNKKFSNSDYESWCEDYRNGLSAQNIYDKYSSIENGPSLSLIKKVIREKGLARTHSEAQKSRVAWNKGKTGFKVWNAGMAKTNSYPYPSPNKGKPSPQKGVPRTKEDKNAIAHSIRLQNRAWYGFYQNRAEEEDYLYLIKVTSDQEPQIQYKVGRTFNTIERRYSWNLKDKEVIKLWSSNHRFIFDLENIVLNTFKNYYQRGPIDFAGSTEFFSDELPLNELILFVDTKLEELVMNS